MMGSPVFAPAVAPAPDELENAMTDIHALIVDAGGPLKADDLIERLHWEADNKGLPPFDGWAWLHQAAAELTRLQGRVAALEAENARLKDSLRQANGVRDVFASAVVAQATQKSKTYADTRGTFADEVDKIPIPQGSQVDKSTGLQGPDPNGVICPNCVTQFRAIPENVQAQLRCAEARVAALEADRKMLSQQLTLADQRGASAEAERDALRADAERTHERICQAIDCRNMGDHGKGWDILRQWLVDVADAARKEKK